MRFVVMKSCIDREEENYRRYKAKEKDGNFGGRSWGVISKSVFGVNFGYDLGALVDNLCEFRFWNVIFKKLCIILIPKKASSWVIGHDHANIRRIVGNVNASIYVSLARHELDFVIPFGLRPESIVNRRIYWPLFLNLNNWCFSFPAWISLRVRFRRLHLYRDSAFISTATDVL